VVAEGQVGRQGRVNAQRGAVLKPQLRRLFERQGLARAEHTHRGLQWRTGLGGIDAHGGQQGRPRGSGGLAPPPTRPRSHRQCPTYWFPSHPLGLKLGRPEDHHGVWRKCRAACVELDHRVGREQGFAGLFPP
jgi:hypothetical protein